MSCMHAQVGTCGWASASSYSAALGLTLSYLLAPLWHCTTWVLHVSSCPGICAILPCSVGYRPAAGVSRGRESPETLAAAIEAVAPRWEPRDCMLTPLGLHAPCRLPVGHTDLV